MVEVKHFRYLYGQTDISNAIILTSRDAKASEQKAISVLIEEIEKGLGLKFQLSIISQRIIDL